MERERRSRDYWREQLSEYWDGGLTIQEYCELKDLPYESVRRWIGILKKEREGKSPVSGELEFVEVPAWIQAQFHRIDESNPRDAHAESFPA